jgi:hypothetical protein
MSGQHFFRETRKKQRKTTQESNFYDGKPIFKQSRLTIFATDLRQEYQSDNLPTCYA